MSTYADQWSRADAEYRALASDPGSDPDAVRAAGEEERRLKRLLNAHVARPDLLPDEPDPEEVEVEIDEFTTADDDPPPTTQEGA